MPSQIKENYLKALYHLHLDDADISTSVLARDLGVSTPTASDMIKKLDGMGLVDYQRYKPVRLTADGLQLAARIIRRHRLSEMFLSQIMGFGWEEVHDIAEELEHIKSTSFFDRMDDLLGYPTSDPHGSPIPDKSGAVRMVTYQALSDVAVGDKVVIRGLKDSTRDFLLYLNRKSIELGTELEVQLVESFDGSRVVHSDAFGDLHLSKTVSDRLLVEVQKKKT